MALAGAAVLLFLAPPAFATEPTGRDVIRRMHAALQRGDGATKLYELRLIDAGGAVTSRQVTAYRKRCGVSTRDLVVLHAPPDVAGSAVLSWTFPDRPPNVWLYLPDLGRVRQMNPFAQGDSFMGSDLTYADLGPIPLDARAHRLVGKRVLQGQSVYEVASTPNGPEPYSRIITWVSALTFLPVRVEYFDGEGRLLRTGHACATCSSSKACRRRSHWRWTTCSRSTAPSSRSSTSTTTSPSIAACSLSAAFAAPADRGIDARAPGRRRNAARPDRPRGR